jgi:hypothetical protein
LSGIRCTAEPSANGFDHDIPVLLDVCAVEVFIIVIPDILVVMVVIVITAEVVVVREKLVVDVVILDEIPSEDVELASVVVIIDDREVKADVVLDVANVISPVPVVVVVLEVAALESAAVVMDPVPMVVVVAEATFETALIVVDVPEFEVTPELDMVVVLQFEVVPAALEVVPELGATPELEVTEVLEEAAELEVRA